MLDLFASCCFCTYTKKHHVPSFVFGWLNAGGGREGVDNQEIFRPIVRDGSPLLCMHGLWWFCVVLTLPLSSTWSRWLIDGEENAASIVLLVTIREDCARSSLLHVSPISRHDPFIGGGDGAGDLNQHREVPP